MAVKVREKEIGKVSVTILDPGSNSYEDKEDPGNEIKVRAESRRFTAKYKQKVLDELTEIEPGEVGGYLCKQGLYSSHITRWRRQAKSGNLTSKKAGRKQTRDYKEERIGQPTKKVMKLEKDLQVAKTIIDVQKKLAVALGIELPEQKERN
jgi:transposase